MQNEPIQIILAVAIIVSLIVFAFVAKAKNTPEKQEENWRRQEERKKQRRRERADKLINLHPGLRAIDKEIERLNKEADNRIMESKEDMLLLKSDPPADIDLDKYGIDYKKTRKYLRTKPKAVLLKIAQDELNLNVDKSITKAPLIDKIWEEYHQCSTPNWMKETSKK